MEVTKPQLCLIGVIIYSLQKSCLQQSCHESLCLEDCITMNDRLICHELLII